MSEIKLDQIGVSIAPAKATELPAKARAEQVNSTDVKVTNHLSQLVGLLGHEEASPEEAARVQATKRLIESGQYQVDVNALSEKLLNSGLLASGG